MFRWASVLLLFCISVAAPASAETVIWVNAPRMAFRDAVPQASGTLALLDLGAAPPPGSSRLFSRGDLLAMALQAHESVSGLAIPTDIRLMRASRRLTASELEALLRPALLAKLPVGVELIRIELPKSYLTVPNVQVSDIQLPRLTKRTGMTRVTSVFELTSGSAFVARLPASVELSLDERATHYTLERGSVLNVFIETGATRVSASAVTMNPADIGDTVPCQIVKTRKVLRVKVLTAHEASVVQQ